jgi:hypothetical protein
VRDFTDTEVASPQWADLLRRNGVDPEQPYDTVATATGVQIIQPSRPRAGYCCEEHLPSLVMALADQVEHCCPACGHVPTLYELLLLKFKRLGFSTLVADDLAERAADVAMAWRDREIEEVPS